MPRPFHALASGLALALLFAPPAVAQSVEEVIEGMWATLERSAERVDDYTLVQSVMGFETQTYFVKEMHEGRPLFRPEQASGGGVDVGSADFDFGGIIEFSDELVEHGRYAGREQLDGRTVHVIAIDDLEQLDLPDPSAPGDDMDFIGRRGRMYVDAELYIPRRFAFEGEATTDTGTHDVTMVVDFTDYREVQGLHVPYRTIITLEGLASMIDPETQAEIDEMMQRLEAMDPQQREMMERMMGPQLQQMREMMQGGGPMTMEVLVTDVRVNAGPPRR